MRFKKKPEAMSILSSAGEMPLMFSKLIVGVILTSKGLPPLVTLGFRSGDEICHLCCF
jgi:hypothetical protein